METLPEKWAFKITLENYQKFKHLRELGSINGYITNGSYRGLNWGCWISNIAHSSYTLIPFELFEKHYLQPKDSIAKSSKPEPRFKVGDTVTYKDHENLPNLGYNYSGKNYGGFRGKIIRYEEFQEKHNCYRIDVTHRDGGEYAMLESEFVEYDDIISKPTPKHLLKDEDKVTFDLGDRKLEYEVYPNFLTYHGDNNDTIFKILGLDKIAFCREHYGYSPSSGDFPECVPDDYAALTRVTDALHKECHKYRIRKAYEESKFEESKSKETTTDFESLKKELKAISDQDRMPWGITVHSSVEKSDLDGIAKYLKRVPYIAEHDGIKSDSSEISITGTSITIKKLPKRRLSK